jgi:hypothetical protein
MGRKLVLRAGRKFSLTDEYPHVGVALEVPGMASEVSDITIVGSNRLLLTRASGGDCKASSEVIQEKDIRAVASF